MPIHPSQLRGAALRLALALSFFTLLPVDAAAQYFGRNKVQWERFDWRVLKTEHFDIYYYPEEEQSVREAARLAERWYERLTSVFEREFFERKPLILYADHSDFQQTTAIGGMIGQGTGGVTESLKTRVILPFTGNWEDTDHVLGHELVHVFQYDILQDRRLRDAGGGGGANVPLWWIEGLAEYLSLGREAPQTAMWLRDALARDTLPTVRRLSRDPRLFPYRWGHAFWAYVGGRWGDVATTRLFTRGTQVGVEAAIEEVLGINHEDFSKDWQAAIRRAYEPVLAGRETPTAAGTRIIPREADPKADFEETNVGPVISPDGREVVFFSTRNLFTFDLFLADATTGDIRGKLLSEDADPHFSALRFLDSAGSWSPDGSKFVLVAFAEGDNELAIFDVRSRKVERRIGVDGVGAMWNPEWSPDGRSILFSGSAGGITDIYVYDLAAGRARKLTDDAFSDLQPSWSPDGRTVAFISDRGVAEQGLAGLTRAPMRVYLLDVAGGTVREALPGFGGDQFNPRFGPGGRDLYFLAEREGVSDLFRLDVGSGEVFRLTRIATGVTGITELSPALTVAERSGRVMFTVFHNAGYQIHVLEPAQTRGERIANVGGTGGTGGAGGTERTAAAAAVLPPADPVRSVVGVYLRDPGGLESDRREPAERGEYEPDLQLDFVGPSVGVGVSSLGYGFGGDIAVSFSDVLGQREVGAVIRGGTGTIDEFGAQAYYLNQERRWQWGVAGGHVPYISAFTTATDAVIVLDGQPTEGVLVQQVRETVTIDEASFITRYPFSTTRRIDFSAGYTQLGFERELHEAFVVGNQIVRDAERDLPSPETLRLFQASTAFVGDTSYFGFTSPVRGRRYHFEIEATTGDLNFQALTADYRRYLFFRPVTLAMRGLHLGRYGSDAESDRLSPLYVGRPWFVRGYDVDDFDLSDCTVLPGDPNACPEFDRLIGSRMAIANLELRVPLFGTRGFGLIELPFLPTELSAFVDAGVAWTEDESPELRYETRSLERVPVVSAGLSARILLGGFAVLEFYYAKPFQNPDAGYVTGFNISPGW